MLCLFRFICKNNGVLFENDIIQIGVKSEFRQNLGRTEIFYGNKTSFPLQVNSVKIDMDFPDLLRVLVYFFNMQLSTVKESVFLCNF